MGNDINIIDTEKLFKEIKNIANEAIASWHTKPKAKPYVNQLRFYGYKLPENPILKNIFYDLVSHVNEASGHGRNKQHWLYFVERDLVLLENELKRTGLKLNEQE